MRITNNQRAVMIVLRDAIEHGTVRKITDYLELPDYGSKRYTDSQVSGYLYRLRQKGLVKSVKSVGGKHSVRWSLTDEGREAINNGL